MSLKTKVKAGNITNLSDARYCAGMGVDWLSFPADVVNPVTFKEITNWVSGPQFVLEVTETTLVGSITEYAVDTLEIASTQLDLINHFSTMEWMIRLPLSSWGEQKNKLLPYADKINYLVLELDNQDLQIIADITAHFKVLINSTDTLELDRLLTLPISGINVAGENELKPGLKDFERLSSILEELEIMD